LIWNSATSAWSAGKIKEIPNGTEEAPHLIWNSGTGEWESGEISVLPEGKAPGKYLVCDISSNPIWDYMRWR